ncbi:polycomb protein Asx isoform X2 [Phlebotomus papatasi]|uniref:polycomb protein Asx isoform X2 n=1 Tax=Phlebotomus papatasi TaxID=29031 RepID=UPI002483565F|nr:polycomb protein Asx isoform X2 [Phlebotomus papatasi]
MECDVTPEKVGGVVQEDDGVEEIVKFTITEVSEKEEVIIPENVDITQDVTDSRDSPAVEEVLPIETSAPEPVLRRSTLQRMVTLPKVSPVPASKVIKHHHSLRRSVPRIIMKATGKGQSETPVTSQASTMKEVLASIPGFSVKPRRRNKKMSTAAQLEQTREGCIDLETPDSILVGTNLRALLNKHTFSTLPELYQHKLVQLLPSVDRPDEAGPSTSQGGIRLNSSSLNNEFFARACLEWRERLAEGEFTPENQLRLKTEAEREKLRLDPWKLKHFEPIWGDKGGKKEVVLPQRPSLKTTIKLRPTATIATSTTRVPEEEKIPTVEAPPAPPRRMRTVGAVTRSTTGSLQSQQQHNSPSKICSPLPDLLPIRTKAKAVAKEPIKEEPKEQQQQQQQQPRDIVTVILRTEVTAESSEQEKPPSPVTEEIVKSEEVNPVDSVDGQPLVAMEEEEEAIPEIPPIVKKEDEEVMEVAEEPPMAPEVSETVIEPEVKVSPKATNNLQEHDYVEMSTAMIVDQEVPEDEEEPAAEEEEEIVEDLVEEQQSSVVAADDTSTVSCDQKPSEPMEEDEDEEAATMQFSLEPHQQNFEGVLQIQPNSLILQGDSLPCVGDEESQSSASALADCSGDNSVDPAAVEELEPTIQNILIDVVDHDNIEQTFTDAENYVLESGEIVADDEASGTLSIGQKLCAPEDIQDDLFVAAVTQALDSVPTNAPLAMTVVSPSETAEVIPMQDTLELRLDDTSYQLPAHWSPPDGASIASTGESSSGKMDGTTPDTFIVSSGGESSSDTGGCAGIVAKSESIIPFSTASQVKLELEVTLTPEAEVSSTVVSQADSDASNEGGIVAKTPTVFPPTTIVCLPTHVTSVQQNSSPIQTGITKVPLTIVSQPQGATNATVQPKVVTQHVNAGGGGKFPTTMILTTTTGPKETPTVAPIVVATVKQDVQATPRAAVAASSSSVPFLSLSAGQPLRSVANVNQVVPGRGKAPSLGAGTKGGGGRRSQSNKPPPGAVNLERSYQICQAVIQNSPNRHQLKHQLRPPPSMLAAAAAANSGSDNSNSSESGSSSGSKKDDQTQHGVVTSTNRTVYKIQGNALRAGLQKKTFGQRQTSPLLVRQVYTSSNSNQGGAGNFISVIPSSGNLQQQSQQQQQILHADGQYVLVQRAGIDNSSMPRASSAPPAQNQQIHGVNGIPISSRGRPASVEVDSLPEQQMILVGPNPGVQAVTRRGPNQVYGDISMDPSLQNFGLAGEGTPPNCACSLNAMVICQQCGNFSHASCVGTSKLCVACDIR